MDQIFPGFSHKPRILIVDDNPSNVELIKKQLSLSGYDLNSAPDGLYGLDRVRKWRPDLILLDLMMPGMSGYDVCKTLKADKELRFIPVIVITALGEMDDKLRAIEMGADDFLIKPFNKTELATRIKSLLKIKALDARNAVIEADYDDQPLPMTGLAGNPKDILTRLSLKAGQQEGEVAVFLARYRKGDPYFGMARLDVRVDRRLNSVNETVRKALARLPRTDNVLP